jgi:hypothetical protein
MKTTVQVGREEVRRMGTKTTDNAITKIAIAVTEETRMIMTTAEMTGERKAMIMDMGTTAEAMAIGTVATMEIIMAIVVEMIAGIMIVITTKMIVVW